MLAEALVLTVLLGSTLKDDDGQLTVQAQTKGGGDSTCCCVRLARWGAARLRQPRRRPGSRRWARRRRWERCSARAIWAITFDVGSTEQRYQGIVPLEGDSLADAARAYFAQSEQLPSLFRVALSRDDHRLVAGGLMLQHLPEGEEGRDRIHTRLDHPEWEHVLALARTVTDGELTDESLSAEELLWRLFNEEEVRLFGRSGVRRGCRCDPTYLASVLARFPAAERAEMANDDGLIEVDCAFCARVFPLDPELLARAA